MSRRDLFEMIGAPLRNHVWSWGAFRPVDQTVFLCVWRDKVRHHEGSNIVPLTNFRRPDKTLGHRERLEHLSRIRSGARSYLFMCEAEDTTSEPHHLNSDFESPKVYEGGRVIQLEGEWWIELLPGPTINELVPKPTVSV